MSISLAHCITQKNQFFTRSHVLVHRTSTQQIFLLTPSHKRVIWSFSSTLLAQRRLIHHLHLCSHDDAPSTLGFHTFTLCSATGTSNSTDRLSHWIIVWSSSQLSEWRRSSLCSNSVSRRNHIPSSGAFSQVCKLENIFTWLQ
jgi:hypothetical protein